MLYAPQPEPKQRYLDLARWYNKWKIITVLILTIKLGGIATRVTYNTFGISENEGTMVW